MSVATEARRIVSKYLPPLTQRAARAYIAGECLQDAMRVGQRLCDQGLGYTLGYWDGPSEPVRHVADEYLAGIAALAESPQAQGYLSIKVPSLDFSHELMAELIGQASRHRVRLHLDALATEMADRSRALCDHFLDAGANLSYTLPGRWQRSVSDAAWANERGIVTRVVKGQWPDPDAPETDLRAGFLRVIDALAGRARHVAVATHDPPLVEEAVRRLRAAGTSCELELLYGLPMRAPLDLADRLKLGVRVYVPYGTAYLPYALGHLRRNPRLLVWLVRDLLSTWNRVERRAMPRRSATV